MPCPCASRSIGRLLWLLRAFAAQAERHDIFLAMQLGVALPGASGMIPIILPGCDRVPDMDNVPLKSLAQPFALRSSGLIMALQIVSSKRRDFQTIGKQLPTHHIPAKQDVNLSPSRSRFGVS